MIISLDKSSGKSLCRSRVCDGNPLYINDKGRIKKDTICVVIKMDSAAGTNTSYYCRGCIDKLYIQLKAILNPNLWIFQ